MAVAKIINNRAKYLAPHRFVGCVKQAVQPPEFNKRPVHKDLGCNDEQKFLYQLP